jgi:hypothetical protein
MRTGKIGCNAAARHFAGVTEACATSHVELFSVAKLTSNPEDRLPMREARKRSIVSMERRAEPRPSGSGCCLLASASPVRQEVETKWP